jgi:hypothetical protein
MFCEIVATSLLAFRSPMTSSVMVDTLAMSFRQYLVACCASWHIFGGHFAMVASIPLVICAFTLPPLPIFVHAPLL